MGTGGGRGTTQAQLIETNEGSNCKNIHCIHCTILELVTDQFFTVSPISSLVHTHSITHHLTSVNSLLFCVQISSNEFKVLSNFKGFFKNYLTSVESTYKTVLVS